MMPRRITPARGSGYRRPACSGVVVVLAALAAVGCTEGEATGDGVTMRVDTLDGVVHIRHTGDTPGVRMASVVAVGEAGGLEEASPAEFGRVRSVMADADGRFYVADALAMEVRVFDRDGRFLHNLGRRGSGPGEFEGLHGVAWLSADTMVAVDYGNARLALMDRAGNHLGQWPWMRATGPVRFYFPVAPGQFYAQGLRSTGDSDDGRRRVEPVWVRYGVDGPIDTLGIPTRDTPAPGSGVICRGEGLGFFTNPHGDRLLTTPAPHGERIVAMAAEYRLAFLDAAGDTIRVLTRDADPPPLTDEVWRETDESYAAFRQQWRGAACEGEIRRPRHRPILRDIAFAHDGRLMVELNTSDGLALDVYDSEWRWTATLQLPDRDTSVPIFLRGDQLYLVARDSLGVQRVEGYRVGTEP
jgi:hypothetical protein